MGKLDVKDEFGISKLERLKRDTFFGEMELRALFNEYKNFKNTTDEKNYVSQSAYRLKRKFEKIMRTMKVFQLTEDINNEDYPKTIQDALDEIMYFWVEWTTGFEKEKFKQLEHILSDEWNEEVFFEFFDLFGRKFSYESLENLINIGIWYSHKRAEKENEELTLEFTEEILETLPLDTIVAMVNSLISIAIRKAKKLDQKIEYWWAEPDESFISVFVDEETEEVEKP